MLRRPCVRGEIACLQLEAVLVDSPHISQIVTGRYRSRGGFFTIHDAGVFWNTWTVSSSMISMGIVSGSGYCTWGLSGALY